MGGRTRALTSGPDGSPDRRDVVPLGREPPPGPGAPPAPRPVTIHGLATTGMAGFAVLGIVALLALVTVNWTPFVSRYVTAALVASAVGFMACASAAVLTAARDTFARPDPRESPDDGDD